ncbi:MAG: hypothetical protein SVK54_09230, partial [candidate division WOR-3 bacterium]|nr:hypothetical protein [candidate division WOR-3 bacterium]
RIGHYSILASLSFIPLLFYSVERTLKEENITFTLLAIASLYMIISGGHPQIFLSAVIVMIIVYNKQILLTRQLRTIMISGFFITGIVWVPLLFQAGLTQRILGGSAITMTPKKLLYSFFPFIHSSIEGMNVQYTGPYNLYECYSYIGIPALYIIFRRYFEPLRRRKFSMLFNKVNVAGGVLIIMSFLPFAGFRIFNTPIRYFGIGLLIIVFEAIRRVGFSERSVYDNIFFLLMVIGGILLIMRGFYAAGIIVSLLWIILYAVVLNIGSLKNVFLVLMIMLAAELLFSSLQLYRWADSSKTVNVKYNLLNDKRILTFLPYGYEYHLEQFSKDYPGENPETAKRFSTIGERGTYYDTYSYNLYSTTTMRSYIETFKDSMILRGGFSNISYLLSKYPLPIDYILVPDIPVVTMIRDSLSIHLHPAVTDTWEIKLDNTIMMNNILSEEYMPDNTKTICIVPGDKLKITGDGMIWSICQSGQYIYFPELFSRAGMSRITQAPFCLMEVPDSLKNSVYYRLNPRNGQLINQKHFDYLPIDVIIGIILLLTGIIITVVYIIRSKENS